MYICQITTVPKTTPSGKSSITHLGWNPFSGLFFPGEGWGRLHFSLCHSLPEPGYLCLIERWGCFPPLGRQTTPISTMSKTHRHTMGSCGWLWNAAKQAPVAFLDARQNGWLAVQPNGENYIILLTGILNWNKAMIIPFINSAASRCFIKNSKSSSSHYQECTQLSWIHLPG